MEPNLSLRILDGAELRQERALPASLTNFINAAYREIEPPGSFDRLPTQDDLWQELSHDGGFCVILQDLSRGGLPVAITGAKRWNKNKWKKEGLDDDNNARVTEPDPSGREEWEIGPVATLNEPQYRKRGLIDRCLACLYNTLLEPTPGKESKTDITVWMKVQKGFRIDYWTRKGFKQVGPESSIPVGEWHSELGFVVFDMCQTISRGSRIMNR